MINLVMVLHGHQPVGNFDHVFQMAYQKCYRPVLDLLNAHQGVKTGLHISGPLFEWIEHNQPECIEMLGGMVERGQVELLSGGFFEPLLAAIPARDARGQIFLMNNYITERFGTRPEGLWLTERVWDSSLPAILKDTGLSYTVVDDTHFYYAGLKQDDIYGPYLTEKEGNTLKLLATPMIMRYMIPFRLVEDVISHLKNQNDMGRNVALYGDDIEKFGLWPGTHEWVLEKGWLETFFSSLERNAEWLQTTLPGEYIASTPPTGRIYLPQASYEEMTEWALPAERSYNLEKIVASLKNEGRWEEWRPFVRGGIWDNFLVKYEESNRMHKKMFFLSEKAADNDEARSHIWRGQCNCAYWHGVFGGLYLGHLRRAVHENLIRAQSSIMANSGKKIALFKDDIDKDGFDELLIWNNETGIGITPKKGGGIFELCHFSTALNLSDILSRRREAYHYELGKIRPGDVPKEKKKDGIPSIHDISQSGEELIKLLVYDKYDKISLLDHFLGENATLQGYAVNEYPEEGDFVQGEYRIEQDNETRDSVMIRLSRKGKIGPARLQLNKSINVKNGSGVTIDYFFENKTPDSVSTRYGCEFNLNLYSDLDPDRYYLCGESGAVRNVSETGSEDNLTVFELVNKSDKLRLIFEFSRPLSLWFYPIMTVSKSEEGFEYSYQGTSLLFHFPMNLMPGITEHFKMKIRFAGTSD
jgi:4-alpha-glucanotransferase